MAQTRILFYQEADDSCPVWEWLKESRADNPPAFAKCSFRLLRLAELGHELRRPEADFLRDGICELRARLRHVNHGLLYFFHGRSVAVVAHALTKEEDIPAAEINRAVARKKLLTANPGAHTFGRRPSYE